MRCSTPKRIETRWGLRRTNRAGGTIRRAPPRGGGGEFHGTLNQGDPTPSTTRQEEVLLVTSVRWPHLDIGLGQFALRTYGSLNISLTETKKEIKKIYRRRQNKVQTTSLFFSTVFFTSASATFLALWRNSCFWVVVRPMQHRSTLSCSAWQKELERLRRICASLGGTRNLEANLVASAEEERKRTGENPGRSGRLNRLAAIKSARG